MHELLAGPLASYFYDGILFVGILLPAALLAGVGGAASPNTMAVVGLTSVIGDFFIKYSTVKAGIHKQVRVRRGGRSVSG